MEKLATAAGPARRLGAVVAIAALIAESGADSNVKAACYAALGVAYLAQSVAKEILKKPKAVPEVKP